MEAIRLAQQKMGDYKLKTASDFVVSEEQRVSTDRKRCQLILLRNTVSPALKPLLIYIYAHWSTGCHACTLYIGLLVATHVHCILVHWLPCMYTGQHACYWFVSLLCMYWLLSTYSSLFESLPVCWLVALGVWTGLLSQLPIFQAIFVLIYR